MSWRPSRRRFYDMGKSSVSDDVERNSTGASAEIEASAGIRAVVQPGGSVRDQEVIDAVNARGLAMLLTGERHFKH